MAKPKKAQTSEIIKVFENAFQDPEIPHIYANGFINAHGNGDVVILLQQNSKPAAVLNLSFTMAKSLALKLGETIKNIEDASGTIIMTTDDIARALERMAEEPQDVA